MQSSRLAPLLYLNVFVIATCGLVYELMAGTLASYLLVRRATRVSPLTALPSA